MTDSGDLFIVHALPPFTLIQAFPEAGRVNIRSDRYQSFAFRNAYGVVEDWTLAILYSEAAQEDAFKVLSKAWRWYRSYMQWEDQQKIQ